jgi:threonine aldolase
MINLISDTVTKPTKEMLQAMLSAEVGDDVFGEDPTVNKLESKAANMFGHEAALFCPSGTMTNQIALQVHTSALDEVICDINSHIFQYEVGGYAYNGRLAINTLVGNNGILTGKMIEDAIKPTYDWLPNTKLVVLENTVNRAGGNYYTKNQIAEIAGVCKNNSLKLHLDGARIFNALVESKDTPKELGQLFDSVSICLSKGLGAPVGSMLIGNKEDIKKARRFRKVMGGGMRQAGYLAAAGIFALDNNIEKLKIDNYRAKKVAKLLEKVSFIENIRPVRSNIIIFDLNKGNAEDFKILMKNNGVLCTGFGPQTIRFVFHLDISNDDFNHISSVIKKL